MVTVRIGRRLTDAAEKVLRYLYVTVEYERTVLSPELLLERFRERGQLLDPGRYPRPLGFKPFRIGCDA